METTYKRKCENWLETYVKWSLPRCESPETYVVWSGLFTLAAALRRHVKVPREKMGGWEISPNLFVIFVAPPGRARKTTTINFGDELLDNLQRITKSPTIVTQAALLQRLVQSDDASVYITSGEFASLISKSKIEMFEFLTDVYDGKKTIEAATISRGIEFAERPCINLLAATTPRWIVENMPESVIGGGFASRVVFVFEDKVRRRQLYYEELNYDHLDKLRTDLIEDLQHIADNVHGDFEIEEDAKSFMEEWYYKNAEVAAADYRLSGYLERRPAHVHKVAMLLHVARTDTLVIEKKDFTDAIYLLSIIEKRLPEVFKQIGKNVHAPDMNEIVEYVKACKRVPRAQLLSQFSSSATPMLLQELISGLIQMDIIHYDGNKAEFVYGSAPKVSKEA